MAGKEHRYEVTIEWIGNKGTGTSNYRAYERSHDIRVDAVPQKPSIPGSSDPAFRGNPARWNPEELLVAALAACHKLWYLHLCATSGVVVTAYVDHAEGEMVEDADGGGRFRKVVLRPRVTIAAGSDVNRARDLHATAHEKCFIANSVNFPVEHAPIIQLAE